MCHPPSKGNADPFLSRLSPAQEATLSYISVTHTIPSLGLSPAGMGLLCPAATSQHKGVMGIFKLWPPNDAQVSSNGVQAEPAASMDPQPG